MATQVEQSTNNLYTIVKGTNGNLAIEALFNKVVILEDKFKTGYECKTCDGKGVIDDVCDRCEGKGVDRFGNPCRECSQGLMPGMKVVGKKRCPTCEGKGGLIIAPQESERRPTSGVIISCGPDCKILRTGDRVLYTNYAGIELNFKQKGVLRIMHEDEILSKLHGTVNVGEVVETTE